jgi:polyhydroxyalkanoate synthesis regulator phasin
VRDALKSYLALAGGVTEVTRQRAVSAAKALVSQGEATAEQVSSLAEDLLTQSRQNREAVLSLVSSEVDRALGRVGLASADEVTALTERVRHLETQVAQLTGAGAPAGAATSAPKAAAKKAPAKEAPAAKAPAAKTAGRKAPAKAPADKPPATRAGT